MDALDREILNDLQGSGGNNIDEEILKDLKATTPGQPTKEVNLRGAFNMPPMHPSSFAELNFPVRNYPTESTGSTLMSDTSANRKFLKLPQNPMAKKVFDYTTAPLQALFIRRLPESTKGDPFIAAVTSPLAIWQSTKDVMQGRTPTNLYGEPMAKEGELLYRKPGEIPPWDTGVLAKGVSSLYKYGAEKAREKIYSNQKARSLGEIFRKSMESGEVANLGGSMYDYIYASQMMSFDDFKKKTGIQIPEWVANANAVPHFIAGMFGENFLDPAEMAEDAAFDPAQEMAGDLLKNAKLKKMMKAGENKTIIDELSRAYKEGDEATIETLSAYLRKEAEKNVIPEPPQAAAPTPPPPITPVAPPGASPVEQAIASVKAEKFTPAGLLEAPKSIYDQNIGLTKGDARIKFPVESAETLKKAGVKFKKSAAKTPSLLVENTPDNVAKLQVYEGEVNRVLVPPAPPDSILDQAPPVVSTDNFQPPPQAPTPQADMGLLARGMNTPKPDIPTMDAFIEKWEKTINRIKKPGKKAEMQKILDEVKAMRDQVAADVAPPEAPPIAPTPEAPVPEAVVPKAPEVVTPEAPVVEAPVTPQAPPVAPEVEVPKGKAPEGIPPQAPPSVEIEDRAIESSLGRWKSDEVQSFAGIESGVEVDPKERAIIMDLPGGRLEARWENGKLAFNMFGDNGEWVSSEYGIGSGKAKEAIQNYANELGNKPLSKRMQTEVRRFFDFANKFDHDLRTEIKLTPPQFEEIPKAPPSVNDIPIDNTPVNDIPIDNTPVTPPQVEAPKVSKKPGKKGASKQKTVQINKPKTLDEIWKEANADYGAYNYGYKIPKKPHELTQYEWFQTFVKGDTPNLRYSLKSEELLDLEEQLTKAADRQKSEIRKEMNRVLSRDQWAARNLHKDFVEDALKSGKPVPAEVLADYPDLAKKYETLEAPKAAPEGNAPPPMGKGVEGGMGTEVEAQAPPKGNSVVDDLATTEAPPVGKAIEYKTAPNGNKYFIKDGKQYIKSDNTSETYNALASLGLKPEVDGEYIVVKVDKGEISKNIKREIPSTPPPDKTKMTWYKSSDFMNNKEYHIEGLEPGNSVDYSAVLYKNKEGWYVEVNERTNEIGDKIGPFKSIAQAKKEGSKLVSEYIREYGTPFGWAKDGDITPYDKLKMRKGEKEIPVAKGAMERLNYLTGEATDNAKPSPSPLDDLATTEAPPVGKTIEFSMESAIKQIESVDNFDDLPDLMGKLKKEALEAKQSISIMRKIEDAINNREYAILQARRAKAKNAFKEFKVKTNKGWKKVDGEWVDMPDENKFDGINVFAHEKDGMWHMTDAKTGLLITKDADRWKAEDKAIEKVREFIDKGKMGGSPSPSPLDDLATTEAPPTQGRESAEVIEQKLNDFFGGDKIESNTITIGGQSYPTSITRKSLIGEVETLPSPDKRVIEKAMSGLKAAKPDLKIKVDGVEAEEGNPYDFLRFVGKTLGVTDMDGLNQKKLYEWAKMDDGHYSAYGKNGKKYLKDDVNEAYELYQRFLDTQKKVETPTVTAPPEVKPPTPKKRRGVNLSSFGVGEAQALYERGVETVKKIGKFLREATAPIPKGKEIIGQPEDRLVNIIGEMGRATAKALGLKGDSNLWKLDKIIHKNMFGLAPSEARKTVLRAHEQVARCLVEDFPDLAPIFGVKVEGKLGQVMANASGKPISPEQSVRIADLLNANTGLWVLKGKAPDANMTGKEYHFLKAMWENNKTISPKNIPKGVIDEWLDRGFIQKKPGGRNYIVTAEAKKVINEISRTPLRDMQQFKSRDSFKRALAAQGLPVNDEDVDIAWKFRNLVNERVHELADIPGAMPTEMKDEIIRWHGRYFRKRRYLMGSIEDMKKALSDPTIRADKEFIEAVMKDDPMRVESVMQKSYDSLRDMLTNATDVGKGNGKQLSKSLFDKAEIPNRKIYVGEDDYEKISNTFQRIVQREKAYRVQHTVPGTLSARIGFGRRSSLTKRTITPTWEESTDYSKLVGQATKEALEDVALQTEYHAALNKLEKNRYIVLPEGEVSPNDIKAGVIRKDGIVYNRIPDESDAWGIWQGRFVNEEVQNLLKTIETGRTASIFERSAAGYKNLWHGLLTNMSGPGYFQRNFFTSLKDQWVGMGLPTPKKGTLKENFLSRYKDAYFIANDIKGAKANSAKIKEYIDMGLFGDENLASISNIYSFLEQGEKGKLETAFQKLQATWTRPSAFANLQDRAARIATYETALASGMSKEEAADFARIVIPSYEESAKPLKVLNTIFPFVSWQAKKAKEVGYQAGRAMKGNTDAMKALLAIPLIAGGVATYQAVKDKRKVAEKQMFTPGYDRYMAAQSIINTAKNKEEATNLAVAEYIVNAITNQEFRFDLPGGKELSFAGGNFGFSPKALPLVGGRTMDNPVLRALMGIVYNIDPKGRTISHLGLLRDPAPYLANMISDWPIYKNAVKAYQKTATKEASPPQAMGEFMKKLFDPKFFKIATEEEIAEQMMNRAKYLGRQIQKVKSSGQYKESRGQNTWAEEIRLQELQNEYDLLKAITE